MKHEGWKKERSYQSWRDDPMVNLPLLLGFTFSGAALGFLLVRGGLILALSQLVTRSARRDAVSLLSVTPRDPNESIAEWREMETPMFNVETESAIQAEPEPFFVPPEKMESCPCGLVLPVDAMIEHRQSTGHVSPGSFASVRTGKIWELEQATVEQTSPDCYKCGKPVKGLKRVGRTIYVSHVGCIDSSSKKHRTRRNRSVTANRPSTIGKENAQRLSMAMKCPICWKPVQKKGSVVGLSSTGSIIRFHNHCRGLDVQNRFA